MIHLSLGLFLFVAVHCLPEVAGWRERAIARWGPGRYMGGFALLSLVGVALMAYGKAVAGWDEVYIPPAWARPLALWLMPLALTLQCAPFFATNWRRLTAHPMLWGVALWALLHLLANGDLASVVLFGGFLLFSLGKIVSLNRRGKGAPGVAVPWRGDVLMLGLGVGSYLVLLWAHPFLFRLPVWY